MHFRRSITAVLRESYESMVLIPRTGKRISVSVLPEVLIRSVSQRPRQHRMLRPLRSMSLRQRRSLDARREARS